ncbi:alkaline phosphatase D family protein [Thermocrinis sp.]
MLSRREFLAYSTAHLLLHNLELLAGDVQEVFPYGVASGDPTPNGIVLWTKINPNLHKRIKKDLTLEVYGEGKEVLRLKFPAEKIESTIRLSINSLEPGQTYYYRFIYAGVLSPLGRFRTLPVEETEEFSLAFITCQNYASGYYPAFRYLAQEDVHFVVHLGDYIYEKVYGAPRVPGRDIHLPSGGNVAVSFEDYQYLYSLYLSDRDFQLLRATHPFIHIWDDHEYANDYAYEYEKGYYVLPGHPFNQDKEKSLLLRKDAIRAWLAYTPTRAVLNLASENPLDWIRIYRDFKVGRLLHLICTDGRSYRTPQPCSRRYASLGCPEQYKTTMLGLEQKRWFFEKLREREFFWKVWANNVQFVSSTIKGLYGSLDAWSGYAGEREEIIKAVGEEGKFIVITGDRHSAVVSEIPEVFKHGYRKVLGAEFITPAVSSVSPAETTWWRDYGARNVEEYAKMELEENPWIKHIDHRVWGYSVLTLRKSLAILKIVGVDKYRMDSQMVKVNGFAYKPGEGVFSIPPLGGQG